ncbi:hypothetical protein HanXRQr2_Chr12g0540201 [Helianthus annuus]|nr:hypothetical protein HanXRQr2_Chr12g0540201 [Helianthus annuus]KAJ0489307.1 hypothetical protein HanHA300_Chr12g0442481 [Helianthus annuus]KAJ0505187.1 hypothetical protein HanHA89_Chr12g0467601 [Helianthus annuus]KAJ0674870.1 hypothetical protein HanLR1_Chr12g0444711 [Helianthus annuus]KAJ0862592.1 hypothetical protein HanPSC8_Chr12g0519981 [Helianthus annuus]
MQYGERFHGFNSKEKSHSSSLHLLMVYTCVIQYMGQVPNLSSNYGFTQVLEICSEKESLTTVYICMDSRLHFFLVDAQKLEVEKRASWEGL